MNKKAPIKTSGIPTYKTGFIKRAPVEDIYWAPKTSEELAEGLATIMAAVPKEAVSYVWDNLTEKSDKQSLREHFNFLWSFHPDGNLPDDRHNQDSMPAHKRDVRYNIYKRPDIGLLLGADRMLPDWQSEWMPKDSKELTLLAYSYGLDVPISHIATTWDRAQRVVGDALINPDFAYTPDPSGRYPDEADGNLGHPMLPNNKTGDHTTWRNMKEGRSKLSETYTGGKTSIEKLCEEIDRNIANVLNESESSKFGDETIAEIEKIGVKKFIEEYYPSIEKLSFKPEKIFVKGDNRKGKTFYVPKDREGEKMTPPEKAAIGIVDGVGEMKSGTKVADYMGLSKQVVSQIEKEASFRLAAMSREEVMPKKIFNALIEGDDSVRSEIAAEIFAYTKSVIGTSNSTIDRLREHHGSELDVMLNDAIGAVSHFISDTSIREFIKKKIFSPYVLNMIAATELIAISEGYPSSVVLDKNKGIAHKFTQSKAFLSSPIDSFKVMLDVSGLEGLYNENNIAKSLLEMDDTQDTDEQKLERAKEVANRIVDTISGLKINQRLAVGDLNEIFDDIIEKPNNVDGQKVMTKYVKVGSKLISVSLDGDEESLRNIDAKEFMEIYKNIPNLQYDVTNFKVELEWSSPLQVYNDLSSGERENIKFGTTVVNAFNNNDNIKTLTGILKNLLKEMTAGDGITFVTLVNMAIDEINKTKPSEMKFVNLNPSLEL